MKNIGLIIILLAFLCGAFLSVLDPETVNWNWMVPVLVAGCIGLWLHRKARHAEDRADDKLAGNMDTLHNALQRILANLEDQRTSRFTRHDLKSTTCSGMTSTSLPKPVKP
jgi:hypothetical protein